MGQGLVRLCKGCFGLQLPIDRCCARDADAESGYEDGFMDMGMYFYLSIYLSI